MKFDNSRLYFGDQLVPIVEDIAGQKTIRKRRKGKKKKKKGKLKGMPDDILLKILLLLLAKEKKGDKKEKKEKKPRSMRVKGGRGRGQFISPGELKKQRELQNRKAKREAERVRKPGEDDEEYNIRQVKADILSSDNPDIALSLYQLTGSLDLGEYKGGNLKGDVAYIGRLVRGYQRAGITERQRQQLDRRAIQIVEGWRGGDFEKKFNPNKGGSKQIKEGRDLGEGFVNKVFGSDILGAFGTGGGGGGGGPPPPPGDDTDDDDPPPRPRPRPSGRGRGRGGATTTPSIIATASSGGAGPLSRYGITIGPQTNNRPPPPTTTTNPSISLQQQEDLIFGGTQPPVTQPPVTGGGGRPKSDFKLDLQKREINNLSAEDQIEYFKKQFARPGVPKNLPPNASLFTAGYTYTTYRDEPGIGRYGEVQEIPPDQLYQLYLQTTGQTAREPGPLAFRQGDEKYSKQDRRQALQQINMSFRRDYVKAVREHTAKLVSVGRGDNIDTIPDSDLTGITIAKGPGIPREELSPEDVRKVVKYGLDKLGFVGQPKQLEPPGPETPVEPEPPKETKTPSPFPVATETPPIPQPLSQAKRLEEGSTGETGEFTLEEQKELRKIFDEFRGESQRELTQGGEAGQKPGKGRITFGGGVGNRRNIRLPISSKKLTEEQKSRLGELIEENKDKYNINSVSTRRVIGGMGKSEGSSVTYKPIYVAEESGTETDTSVPPDLEEGSDVPTQKPRKEFIDSLFAGVSDEDKELIGGKLDLLQEFLELRAILEDDASSDTARNRPAKIRERFNTKLKQLRKGKSVIPKAPGDFDIPQDKLVRVDKKSGFERVEGQPFTYRVKDSGEVVNISGFSPNTSEVDIVLQGTTAKSDTANRLKEFRKSLDNDLKYNLRALSRGEDNSARQGFSETDIQEEGIDVEDALEKYNQQLPDFTKDPTSPLRIIGEIVKVGPTGVTILEPSGYYRFQRTIKRQTAEQIKQEELAKAEIGDETGSEIETETEKEEEQKPPTPPPPPPPKESSSSEQEGGGTGLAVSGEDTDFTSEEEKPPPKKKPVKKKLPPQAEAVLPILEQEQQEKDLPSPRKVVEEQNKPTLEVIEKTKQTIAKLKAKPKKTKKEKAKLTSEERKLASLSKKIETQITKLKDIREQQKLGPKLEDQVGVLTDDEDAPTGKSLKTESSLIKKRLKKIGGDKSKQGLERLQQLEKEGKNYYGEDSIINTLKSEGYLSSGAEAETTGMYFDVLEQLTGTQPLGGVTQAELQKREEEKQIQAIKEGRLAQQRYQEETGLSADTMFVMTEEQKQEFGGSVEYQGRIPVAERRARRLEQKEEGNISNHEFVLGNIRDISDPAKRQLELDMYIDQLRRNEVARLIKEEGKTKDEAEDFVYLSQSKEELLRDIRKHLTKIYARDLAQKLKDGGNRREGQIRRRVEKYVEGRGGIFEDVGPGSVPSQFQEDRAELERQAFDEAKKKNKYHPFKSKAEKDRYLQSGKRLDEVGKKREEFGRRKTTIQDPDDPNKSIEVEVAPIGKQTSVTGVFAEGGGKPKFFTDFSGRTTIPQQQLEEADFTTTSGSEISSSESEGTRRRKEGQFFKSERLRKEREASEVERRKQKFALPKGPTGTQPVLPEESVEVGGTALLNVSTEPQDFGLGEAFGFTKPTSDVEYVSSESEGGSGSGSAKGVSTAIEDALGDFDVEEEESD